MDKQNDKKLRVLFVAPYEAGIGGLTLWSKNILDYYHSQSSCDIEIDGLSVEGTPIKYVKSILKRTYIGVVKYIKVIREETRILKNKQYDVMHLCSSASISLLKDIIMLRVARKYNVRTVVHFHFGRIPALKEANNWEWKLFRRVVSKADVAVPIDQMSYDALVSAGFNNAVYLPNPVALQVSDYVSKHEGEPDRDERMVFYAGHCVKTKGIYELVRACSKIENVRLVLAGRILDDTRKELAEIAHNEPWLEMLGQVSHDEILNLMLQCGVYVLPSYTEGFPNVILESMTCGCAIVATTVGAIPEMIGEENGSQFGLLVPPQDDEKLREAISELLSNKALREECRRNAQERVNKRYNIGSVWQKLTEIWRLAAEKKQTAA